LAKPKGKITPAKTQIENPNFHSSFHIEQKITKTHQSLGPNNLKNQFIPSTETKIQTLTKTKKKPDREIKKQQEPTNYRDPRSLKTNPFQ
jgi:hypothetical protein